MKNRRGAYSGTTADKDKKTGKHLKCYASSYSNQDIIKYLRFGMLILFAMSVPFTAQTPPRLIIKSYNPK